MSRQRTMEAILASEYVTIGELVRLTECRYQRKESVERIQMIRNFREAGKTIPEIKKILRRVDGECV